MTRVELGQRGAIGAGKTGLGAVDRRRAIAENAIGLTSGYGTADVVGVDFILDVVVMALRDYAVD